MTNCIDPIAKQCIDSITELLSIENRREINNQGLYKKYEKIYKQIQQELGDFLGISLLKRYEALMEEEILFFDPYETYLAGRELKLDGEIDRNEAYDWYVFQIRKSEEYRQLNKERNEIFGKIMDLLVTEEMKDEMYKLCKLHSVIYATNKRKLRVFFDLGFESCFIYPDDISLWELF